MTFFEQEMRRLFGSNMFLHDKKFCDKTLIGKLDGDLRIKLSFIATEISNQYNAIRLKVINRMDGEIDAQTFRFADIIGSQRRPGLTDIDPCIWEYGNDIRWYIPVSSAACQQIADTISDYISIYQCEETHLNVEDEADMDSMNHGEEI